MILYGPDHVQVNCRLKVNCRKKFGLVCKLLADLAQILSYKSLLVYTIHIQLQFTCT